MTGPKSHERSEAGSRVLLLTGEDPTPQSCFLTKRPGTISMLILCQHPQPFLNCGPVHFKVHKKVFFPIDRKQSDVSLQIINYTKIVR